MNVNTITRNKEEYASGKLPIALYKCNIAKRNGKDAGYYGRAASRTTLNMKNIAEDLIVTKALEGFPADAIVNVWNKVNGAVIDRVLNGFIVDAGIGSFQAKISGKFTSQQDNFDPKRHSIDVGYRSSSSVKNIASKMQPLILQGNSCVPEIVSVTDVATNEAGHLTPQNLIRITGKNIMVCGNNEDVGLWFVNTEDESKSTVVKAEQFGINKSNVINCIIPALDAGTYRIKLVTQYSKSAVFRKESLAFTTDEEFTVKA